MKDDDILNAFTPLKTLTAMMLGWYSLLWEWYINEGHTVIGMVLATLLASASVVYMFLGIQERIMNNRINKKKLEEEEDEECDVNRK